MRYTLVSLSLSLVIFAPLVLAQTGNLTDQCAWCANNAACSANNQGCECLSGYEGDGALVCYNSTGQNVCSLCDDPILNIFTGPPSVRLFFTDSFKLTDDSFSKISNDGTRRIYMFKTFVSGYRVKGKIYPRCITIKFDVFTTVGANVQHCQWLFKVFGWWNNDTESLMFSTKEGTQVGNKLEIISDDPILPLNSNKTNVICGCGVKFVLANGMFRADFSECIDYEIGFRPFIPDYPHIKSGIYVVATNERPSPPLIPSVDSTELSRLPVCLLPGQTMEQLQTRLDLFNSSDAAAWLAINNLSPNFFDGMPANQQLSAGVLNCNATLLPGLFESVRAFSSLHPVINCISGAGSTFSEYIEMLEDLVENLCEGDVTACENVKNLLNSRCSALLAARSNDPAYSQIVAFATKRCGPKRPRV